MLGAVRREDECALRGGGLENLQLRVACGKGLLNTETHEAWNKEHFLFNDLFITILFQQPSVLLFLCLGGFGL